jgi:NTP pyrophosphatase (non-canonical NTP hydrolase)
MNFEEYELGVQRTMGRPAEVSGPLYDNVIFALGVAGEAGEVADLIKKWTGHGHTLDLDKLEKELGDVLWYVTALAKANCLTLEGIAQKNLEKLRKRYPAGFSFEASINRKE